LGVTCSEVLFCSHLCPPLHSLNSCRGLDDTDVLLEQSVADTYTMSGILSEYLCKKKPTNETKICATASCISLGKFTDMYRVAKHYWYNRENECWRQLGAVQYCPSYI
jgi:hypothetical protein